jgi:hypothetical protein
LLENQGFNKAAEMIFAGFVKFKEFPAYEIWTVGGVCRFNAGKIVIYAYDAYLGV